MDRESLQLLFGEPEPRTGPLRVLGISTGSPGASLSCRLLDIALEQAREEGAETRRRCLGELDVPGCPKNGSCVWPCTQVVIRDDDPLTSIYIDLLHWSDVVLIAGEAGRTSLDERFSNLLARLRALRVPLDTEGRLLIRNQVAALLPVGDWEVDGAPIAEALAKLGTLGFALPAFPVAGYQSGCLLPPRDKLEEVLRLHPEIEARARGLASRAIAFAQRIRPTRQRTAAIA